MWTLATTAKAKREAEGEAEARPKTAKVDTSVKATLAARDLAHALDLDHDRCPHKVLMASDTYPALPVRRGSSVDRLRLLDAVFVCRFANTGSIVVKSGPMGIMYIISFRGVWRRRL